MKLWLIYLFTYYVKLLVHINRQTHHVAQSRTQVIHFVHTATNKTTTLKDLVQWVDYQRQHIPLSLLGNSRVQWQKKYTELQNISKILQCTLQCLWSHKYTYLPQTSQHSCHSFTIVKRTSLWPKYETSQWQLYNRHTIINYLPLNIFLDKTAILHCVVLH